MNYYKILGLTPEASPEEIKSAFRKLSKAYHPDRKGGSTELFCEINQAYQVLRDPLQRAEYDRLLYHKQERYKPRNESQYAQRQHNNPPEDTESPDTRSERNNTGCIIVVGAIILLIYLLFKYRLLSYY
ncbi:MAG: DnaJ domain-containing protein [Prevotellaceae bacterium]|nr:DnaJ domain-containing protein [Prevotellaceae bacterium]